MSESPGGDATPAGSEAARLAAILESSPSIIVALDRRFHLTDINGAARRILGLGDADIGRYLGDVVDARRTPSTPDRGAELRRVLDGATVAFDTRLRAVDGTQRTIDFTLAPIRSPDGTVTGISAIGRDVTRERRAEEQRRNLAAIVESARDPILAARPDGTVVSWNHAAEETFGVPADRALGRDLADVVPAWLRCEQLRLGERVARGETVVDVEVQAASDEGAPVHHAVSVFPIRDARGELTGSAVLVHDVTEAWRLREQLDQARRLESLGRLAGGIAHDFNNLMAVITGYGGILEREVRGETAGQALGEIQRAARRATELTAQLLAFSRRRPGTRTTIDVAATVLGLQAMLARLLGADVELTVSAADGVVPVVADRAQLEQVIVNLAINARDAMPAGGRLHISADTVVLGEADDRLGLEPGTYARVTVADSGSGIAPDDMPRIFEPFFTTKAPGRGTGLGLASVHGSVAQAGGGVAAESALGSGSTFRVFLPAAPSDAPPPVALPEDRPGPAPGGTETVLLCEDEDALRALLQRTLSRAGYHVEAAQDADDALALAGRLEGGYDALVTDVVMPGGSGLRLAEELARRHGERPLLLISGYNAESLDGSSSLPAGSAFLEKPFDVRDLLATLRTLLDRRGPVNRPR